jgi:hypothetical protein
MQEGGRLAGSFSKSFFVDKDRDVIPEPEIVDVRPVRCKTWAPKASTESPGAVEGVQRQKPGNRPLRGCSTLPETK